ncbi:MAG: NAD(P)/FAD-dependent oxidoreductase [Rhodospirillales bacterium]|nr:NAD(P)/FAD-dependent oxidoreductase [Rhodospirillales bacterium]
MINTSTTAKRWCVVGGGLLGLTLAHRLAQSGQSVTLLEAAPDLGGLASAWQVGDVTWDRYYHVIMLSDAHLRRLLDEFGLDHGIDWKVTRTGFFTGHGLHNLNNAVDYLKFPALNLVDKVRLGLTIMYMARIKDGRPLESIPLSDWLTRLSGKRVFENIWRPLICAKLGDNYRKASASFIWSYARRFYAARQGGMKTEMFGYVPGGYARILNAFASKLAGEGVDVRTSAPVELIRKDASGAFKVTTRDRSFEFDRVVVTAAAPLAAKICDGLTEDERKRLEGVVYNGVICASALLRRPLGGYYLTYITDPTMPFTTVIEMSALVDAAQHCNGQSLVYLPRYVTAEDEYWSLSDAEIERRFFDGLVKIYPDLKPEDVTAFRVARARQVYAVTTIGYSDRLPPMLTSVPGLSIVNSAHIVNASLAVNETVALAEAALPKLLDEPRSDDCAATPPLLAVA